jgi:hypothetical protein
MGQEDNTYVTLTPAHYPKYFLIFHGTDYGTGMFYAFSVPAD